MTARSDQAVYLWGVNVSHYERLVWYSGRYNEDDDRFCRSQLFGDTWYTRELTRSKDVGRGDSPISDCPIIGSCVRVVSDRALVVVRDLIEPTSEILPVNSELGTFWAVNSLAKVDCIDFTRSNFRTDSADRLAEVYVWAFDPQRLPDVHYFRVPYLCTEFLVSQTFVDRVRSAKLLGFRFELLWSAKEGPKERMSAMKGTFIDLTDPWEMKEIRRMKREIRERRNQIMQQSKVNKPESGTSE